MACSGLGEFKLESEFELVAGELFVGRLVFSLFVGEGGWWGDRVVTE